MSYISILLPAFHLNTTDISEISKQCSIQFCLSPDKFDVFEREISNLLRKFFVFYGTYEEYHIEGLKFFSLFPEIGGTPPSAVLH